MTAAKKESDIMAPIPISGKKSKKPPKGKQPKTKEQEDLITLMGSIEKQWGSGAVMMMGDRPIVDVPVISTGSLRLNNALGIGGYPRGRIIELFGQESSGKTTLALHAIAEAQKAGGVAAFVDAEHALDIKYARALGVDVDNLLLSQPDFGEQGLEITETLVRSGLFSIVVVDSVAALVPRAEVEGEMGDSHMGLQARLMSQACRKLASVVGSTGTLLVFINQLRMKIGVVFGNPEVTTGGNALKFYASCRLEIRSSGKVKKGDELLGNGTKVKVVKNKMAPPFKVADFDILYGKGISRVGEIIDDGVLHDIIDKSGAWYSYQTSRIGQGRTNACEWLEEHPTIMDTIEEAIVEAMKE